MAPHAAQDRQAGAATIEFALSFMIFWVAFIGVVEFSRLMFVWGTAAEATQLAARLASICETSPSQETRIRAHVAQFVTASGQVDLAGRTDWLQFTYYPSGCTNSTCTQVEASLNNIPAHMIIPISISDINLPTFRTRQARETMTNSMGIETNDVCN